MGNEDNDSGGDDDAGGGHYNKSSGITPPSASSRRHHQWAGPIVAVWHSGSASPRKKDHVPFLVVAAPPLVRLRLPSLIRLSFALMAGCRVTFCRVAFTLRRAPPFPVHSTHGSIADAPFASPSCRPSSLPLRCLRAVHHPRCEVIVVIFIAIAVSTSILHCCHHGRSVTPAIAVHRRRAIHCRLR